MGKDLLVARCPHWYVPNLLVPKDLFLLTLWSPNIWTEQIILGPEKCCLLILSKIRVSSQCSCHTVPGQFGELTVSVKITHLPVLETFRAGPTAQHRPILLQSTAA